MAEHNRLGQEGELLASSYLESEGYSILHKNWHSGHKELDLVAVKERTLVVAEVKTRYNDVFGSPRDAVNDRKIRRIVSATDAYLRMYSIDLPVRFDIITIIYGVNSHQIEHIEDAFFAPVW